MRSTNFRGGQGPTSTSRTIAGVTGPRGIRPRGETGAIFKGPRGVPFANRGPGKGKNDAGGLQHYGLSPKGGAGPVAGPRELSCQPLKTPQLPRGKRGKLRPGARVKKPWRA